MKNYLFLNKEHRKGQRVTDWTMRERNLTSSGKTKNFRAEIASPVGTRDDKKEFSVGNFLKNLTF